MIENEREEVDIQVAAHAVLDTLDISEDKNYVSCSEDMTDLIQINYHEEELLKVGSGYTLLQKDF